MNTENNITYYVAISYMRNEKIEYTPCKITEFYNKYYKTSFDIDNPFFPDYNSCQKHCDEKNKK